MFSSCYCLVVVNVITVFAVFFSAPDPEAVDARIPVEQLPRCVMALIFISSSSSSSSFIRQKCKYIRTHANTAATSEIVKRFGHVLM